MCKGCGKTFTVPLKGAMAGRSLTHLERAAILAELDQGDTFERAARAHGMSKTEAVNVFDEAYPEVRRRPLPRILLIDEFKFSTPYSKYCCHLVDFFVSMLGEPSSARPPVLRDAPGSAPGSRDNCLGILEWDAGAIGIVRSCGDSAQLRREGERLARLALAHGKICGLVEPLRL